MVHLPRFGVCGVVGGSSRRILGSFSGNSVTSGWSIRVLPNRSVVVSCCWPRYDSVGNNYDTSGSHRSLESFSSPHTAPMHARTSAPHHAVRQPHAGTAPHPIQGGVPPSRALRGGHLTSLWAHPRAQAAHLSGATPSHLCRPTCEPRAPPGTQSPPIATLSRPEPQAPLVSQTLPRAAARHLPRPQSPLHPGLSLRASLHMGRGPQSTTRGTPMAVKLTIPVPPAPTTMNRSLGPQPLLPRTGLSLSAPGQRLQPTLPLLPARAPWRYGSLRWDVGSPGIHHRNE